MKKFAVYVPPLLNDVAQEKMFSLGYIWQSETNTVKNYGKKDGMVLSTTDCGKFLFRQGRDYSLCDDHRILTLDEFFIMRLGRNAVDMGDGRIALILEDKVIIGTLLIDSKAITALCRTIQSTDFPEFRIKTIELRKCGHSSITIHADNIITLGKAIEILSKNETDSK